MIKTSQSLPISAVVFTKNEELNIQMCINSLGKFSEIVVLDSMSTDNTKQIASNNGLQVVDFQWNHMYPKKRQWSLQNVSYKNDWILFVDADERISDGLLQELSDFMSHHAHTYVAASLPVEYIFAGKILRHGQRPRKIALLKIGENSFPEIDDLASDGMGELEGHYQPTSEGKVKKFKSGITHDDKDPIASWMIRHINYAKWESYLLENPNVKNDVNYAKGWFGSLFHRLPFRPVVFFVYCYFVRMGFLDGKAGFDYAFAKSWYYWLSGLMVRERKRNDRDS